jgi:hypothetical protein
VEDCGRPHIAHDARDSVRIGDVNVRRSGPVAELGEEVLPDEPAGAGEENCVAHAVESRKAASPPGAR